MRVTFAAVVLAATLVGPAPLLAQDRPAAGRTAMEGRAESTDQVDIRDLVARVLGRDQPAPDEVDDAETRFVLLPTFGGNPAVGLAVGVLGNLTGYWGDPTETRLSSMVMNVSVTTRKHLLVAGRSDFYTPGDRWHLAGDWRLYLFQERTHGLGSDSTADIAADVDYTWVRFHQVGYRRLWGDWELGAGYHLDLHADMHLAGDQPIDQSRSAEGPTTSSGWSVNMIYDTRDNPLNAERGLYGRASYTFYRESLGSDDDWEDLQLETRAYHRLPTRRRQVVTLWGLSRLTRAGRSPYFDLPSSGWDTYGRTARGYRIGRFRGKDWIYGEFEYRADLLRNGLVGLVGFVNTSTLNDFESRDFQRWVIGGGVGGRFKLDKERRSSIAVDLAWGREGSVGLFLGLNEAF